jgi:mRNA interferase MazF
MVKRGEIYMAKLDPVIGSEQGNTRPVLIVQNNIGNEFSSTTIIVPMTKRIFSKNYPTNVRCFGLHEVKGTFLTNQIRAVDKQRFIRLISKVDEQTMKEVDKALKISLGLK